MAVKCASVRGGVGSQGPGWRKGTGVTAARRSNYAVTEVGLEGRQGPGKPPIARLMPGCARDPHPLRPHVDSINIYQVSSLGRKS